MGCKLEAKRSLEWLLGEGTLGSALTHSARPERNGLGTWMLAESRLVTETGGLEGDPWGLGPSGDCVPWPDRAVATALLMRSSSSSLPSRNIDPLLQFWKICQNFHFVFENIWKYGFLKDEISWLKKFVQVVLKHQVIRPSKYGRGPRGVQTANV